MATRWLVVGTRQLFRRGVLAYPVPNVVRSRHTARTRITAKMTAETKTFRLALIKPSHYDDDGYVIQWFRSSMPSNSLAAVYGLAMDCAARQVLGADTAITVDAYDETNTRLRPERIARDIAQAGAGMVGFVGVQSNQYPRALDLAR